jgi:hypothetical protein
MMPLQHPPPTQLGSLTWQDDLPIGRDADERERGPLRAHRLPEQLHHARICAAVHHHGVPCPCDRDECLAEKAAQALLAPLVEPRSATDHHEDRPWAAQAELSGDRRHVRVRMHPGHGGGMAVAEVEHLHPRPSCHVLATVLNRSTQPSFCAARTRSTSVTNWVRWSALAVFGFTPTMRRWS